MEKTVEFFFDVGSPASYLAYTQLPALCARQQARLIYKPFILGAVFKATGNASPAAVPAKGRYSFVDFTRWAAHWGVPLVRNPHFPINTIPLMKIASVLLHQDPDRFIPYLDHIFAALWTKAANLNDPAILAAVVAEGGFDQQALEALAATDDARARLRATTEEAVARGCFGAPSFFVGDDLYWGQDRLWMVEAALAAG